MLPTPYLSINHCLAIGLAAGLSSISLVAMAGDPSSASVRPVKQVARYSVTRPGPSPGQRDLLAVAAPVRVPSDIATVGGALGWVIEASGYRLASIDHLPIEVQDMLNLPLPKAHRAFPALPIREVISLLAGPAFVLVQDPVHRLLAFERCRDSDRRRGVVKSTQDRTLTGGED